MKGFFIAFFIFSIISLTSFYEKVKKPVLTIFCHRFWFMRVYSTASILLLSLTILICTLTPSFAQSNSVLDNQPVQTYPVTKLPRWEAILSSHLSETYNSQNPNVKTWNDFITTLQGQPKLRQLLKVNMWFEQFTYKQDNWVYKQDDYWATPTEFLTKGGDCEDYAIIKYMTLRQLGFPASAMKIAMVYDVYSGTDHAFLTVNHEGAEFVLDNREKVVVARYMKNRYKPHFAFNEENVWIYDSPVMVQNMRKDTNGEILPGNR